MPSVPHPGQTEIGFLSDMRAVAERIGAEVLRKPIRWEVEQTLKKSAKRPDVVIRWDETGQVIASGEAKRPDEPAGVHPLVTTEVNGALDKAGQLGSSLCFTTNFFEVAVLRADQNHHYPTLLDRVVGSLVALVPESLATGEGWWSTLSTAQREAALSEGLRAFFALLRDSLAERVSGPDVNEITLLVFRRTTDQLVADLTPLVVRAFETRRLPLSVIEQAQRAHLEKLDNVSEARHLCAQVVAE